MNVSFSMKKGELVFPSPGNGKDPNTIVIEVLEFVILPLGNLDLFHKNPLLSITMMPLRLSFSLMKGVIALSICVLSEMKFLMILIEIFMWMRMSVNLVQIVFIILSVKAFILLILY